MNTISDAEINELYRAYFLAHHGVEIDSVGDGKNNWKTCRARHLFAAGVRAALTMNTAVTPKETPMKTEYCLECGTVRVANFDPDRTGEKKPDCRVCCSSQYQIVPTDDED